jgi:hypothetical protein
MKALIPLTSLALLSACATPGGPPAYSAEATTFTGYVRFSDNEFQLYPRQAQVDTAFSRPCLSGALPRDLMRSARSDLSGQQVEFTGRTAPWAGRIVSHEGVDITNTCGGDFVLLADTVRVIR